MYVWLHGRISLREFQAQQAQALCSETFCGRFLQGFIAFEQFVASDPFSTGSYI